MPGVRFKSYAVLGDDVVIASPAVATQYRRELEDLGVEISPSKTLISDSGCAEFAKRFGT